MSKEQTKTEPKNQEADAVLSAGAIVRREFPLNSDIIKLINMLDNQIQSRDWHPVEYSFTRHDKNDVSISVNNDDVGFSFDGKGRFKFIFNW